ncbi:murein biosynthesis integral membrane protein MurJ [Serinicoccus kebangsaanensis]|uniref:murein biosynthesis integral membrane protein MurJ n=1 Tax=Serinicoccus kebangsaanensis TaxID=2602069 RepID=UPI00124C2257|nr:murein biosynthesis integral membrane protein MurJ [Serinicoccus kebangsaanensis]
MVARASIGRAAVLVAGLTGVSTLLGFARDAVIAGIYGAGPELDAYFVALGLANIVLGLLGTSLTRAATPVLSREAHGEEVCRGHRTFDVVLTGAVIAIGALSVVLGLAAAPISRVLAPGLTGDAADLLVLLTRIILVTTVLVAATDLLAALAQAHGVFRWGALQGVPFNLVMIAAAGLLGPRIGVVALAVGFVVGSLARLALQLVPVVQHRWPLRPRLDARSPGVREIAALLPPLVVGQAALNVNTLVDRAVASTVGEGAVSAVFLGWRLVNLPEMLVVAALVAPLYPAMSAAAGEGAAGRARMRRLVHQGLAVSLTLLGPVAAALLVAPQEVVTLAFGRGAFDDEAVRLTAVAVICFLPGLLALACRQVVVSACYAVGDTRGPVAIGLLAMVVNVVGDLTLAPVLGVAGIVAATSASLLVAAVLTGWLAAGRHRLVPLRDTGLLLGRSAAALVGAGVVAWLALRAVGPELVLVRAVLALVAAALAYQLVLALLRAPERFVALHVAQRFRRR